MNAGAHPLEDEPPLRPAPPRVQGTRGCAVLVPLEPEEPDEPDELLEPPELAEPPDDPEELVEAPMPERGDAVPDPVLLLPAV